MFFTRFVRTIAIIGLAIGAMQVGLGFGIATEIFGPYNEALRRYGGSATSSGEVIDKGFYIVLVCLVLGVLSEISSNIKNLRD